MQLSNLVSPEPTIEKKDATPAPLAERKVIARARIPALAKGVVDKPAQVWSPAHEEEDSVQDKMLNTAIEQLKIYPAIYQRLKSWD